MIKKYNKAVSFILALLLMLSAMTITAAAKDTASISIGSGSCDVGDEVSVSVSVSSSVDIYMCDIWLNYDSSILQPVSGYSGGGGGSIRLLSTDTTSFTVKFKAVDAGTSSISVSTSNTIVSSATEDYMSVSAGTGSVSVKAPVTYSTDNTLSSLEISPGVLSPAFSPNVTSYTTTVGADCDKLTVSATANDSNASVSVKGTRMDPGSNTTTITVTAQDGSKKVYTIYTTKDSEEKTTEAETKPEESSKPEESTVDTEELKKVTLLDAEYTIDGDFEANPLPSGYMEIDYDYNGISVKAGKGINTKLVLMYLQNNDGKGQSGFYIYDSVMKSFSLYHEIAQPDITYAVLSITDNMEKPEGYRKTVYSLNGISADVLMDQDGRHYLFYGVNSLGVTGWFEYDSQDGTIQTYHGQAGVDVDVLPADSEAVTQNSNDVWKVMALILVAAVIVLLIVIIVLAIKLSKNKRAFAAAANGDYYDDDYENDEYDFDDYEEDDDEELEEDALSDDSEENVSHKSEKDVLEDEMVRSISNALSGGGDDELELLEIDDVDEVKRT